MDDVGHERLAGADVAVRVLVAGRAAALVEERRVDERERGERPALAAVVVVRDALRAVDPGLAPKGGDGEVRVEVLAVDALRLEGGEDGRIREAVRVSVGGAR